MQFWKEQDLILPKFDDFPPWEFFEQFQMEILPTRYCARICVIGCIRATAAKNTTATPDLEGFCPVCLEEMIPRAI